MRRTLLAARPSRSAFRIGMPPATAASKASATPRFSASRASSAPCRAIRALLAVTTCLPRSSAAVTSARAGSSLPPISSTTASISGAAASAAGSSSQRKPVRSIPRSRARLRAETAVTTSARPARRASSAEFSRSRRSVPAPTVPSPAMPILSGGFTGAARPWRRGSGSVLEEDLGARRGGIVGAARRRLDLDRVRRHAFGAQLLRHCAGAAQRQGEAVELLLHRFLRRDRLRVADHANRAALPMVQRGDLAEARPVGVAQGRGAVGEADGAQLLRGGRCGAALAGAERGGPRLGRGNGCDGDGRGRQLRRRRWRWRRLAGRNVGDGRAGQRRFVRRGRLRRGGRGRLRRGRGLRRSGDRALRQGDGGGRGRRRTRHDPRRGGAGAQRVGAVFRVLSIGDEALLQLVAVDRAQRIARRVRDVGEIGIGLLAARLEVLLVLGGVVERVVLRHAGQVAVPGNRVQRVRHRAARQCQKRQTDGPHPEPASPSRTTTRPHHAPLPEAQTLPILNDKRGARRCINPVRTGIMKEPHPREIKVPDPVAWSRSMAELAERSQRLVQDFLARQADGAGAGIIDPLNVGSAFFEMTRRLMSDPAGLVQAQLSLWQDYLRLWQTTTQRFLTGEQADPIAKPAPGDRRFNDAAWSENALFDYIKQSYLLTARWLQSIVHHVEGLR